jgi:hypothetical protein
MDPDPVIFVNILQDISQKFFPKFFCLLLFQGTFTSFSKIKCRKELHNFSKIKSHKEARKQQESVFFLLFLLDDGISRLKDPDP